LGASDRRERLAPNVCRGTSTPHVTIVRMDGQRAANPILVVDYRRRRSDAWIDWGSRPMEAATTKPRRGGLATSWAQALASSAVENAREHGRGDDLAPLPERSAFSATDEGASVFKNVVDAAKIACACILFEGRRYLRIGGADIQ